VRFFCEYCNVFLPHEGIDVRREHRKGRRHKENVRAYYQLLIKNNPDIIQEIAQSIDQSTSFVVPPFAGRQILPVGFTARPFGDTSQFYTNMVR